MSFAWAENENWNFSESQRWIGDSAEGSVEFCKEKSIRWDSPQLGFDINQDSIDDFMVAISCYQGEAPQDGGKHNLKVRAAWKMYCSSDKEHYDCTQEIFQSDVIEVTAVSPDVPLGNDGGGNPYLHVMEKPRDLNNDGFPEFWYAVNRDDGREGFDFSDESDYAMLESYCGPQPTKDSWLWDCTRKSIQTMLISNSDGTYQIKQMPWGVQNTQAVLILPNSIGTFDVWALIYGPHKVARYIDGKFIDVTTEYEQDPLWDKITLGNPYAKAFSHDGSFYVAKADIPRDYRPDWAMDIDNSGFILLEYRVGEGFSVSDVFTPKEDETFFYSLAQGDSVQTRFGTMIKDVPVFDPRWHFFNFEILDNSKEPVLIVQSEAFTQAGNAFKASFDSEIIYSIGDKFSTRSTKETIWGGYSAVEGFYIRNGKLVARSEEIVAGNGINSADFKQFVDIDSDGFIDSIVVSGEGRPSAFINNGSGTLEKVFLGDMFPDLFRDSDYWELTEDHNIAGWGAALYPFYSPDKLDLLYWTKGYQFRIPSYLPDDYEFSPGDIVLTEGKVNISQVKKFSVTEQHTLFETCVVNGYFGKDGFQLPCSMGIPFPNDSEIDSDGDGVVDSQDELRLDAAESMDTDNDGIGNNADNDDDNDGVLDASDAFPRDGTETADFDLDGIGNNADTDDDNDGIADANDPYPYNANHDSDGDGVNNSEDAFPQNNLYSSDSDQDGMPDAWEMLFGLDPNDASDAISDEDLDGANALAEFLANSTPSLSLDVDGNGRFDALTDGLLVLRSLFGLTDSALINGAVASDATITDPKIIASNILAMGTQLDIDNNGSIDALTDGLIILRYLFGLRGDVMISSVIANDAERTDVAELEGHLKGISSSNLQPPLFTTWAEYRVREGQLAIGKVSATDADTVDSLISFSINSSEISITQDGELSFVSVPDVETKSIYSAVVTATDGENSSSQEIQISIKYGYEYADHWDSHLENLNKIRAVYTNEIGFNLDEIWFKSLSIPKTRFSTSREDYYLSDPNFSGSVGFDTWFTSDDKTYFYSCNWVPRKKSEGGIKVFEYINGEFSGLIYKEIEGCNHPFSIKNTDGSFQHIFLGIDEGKIPFGEVPIGPTYTFDLSTKQFTDIDLRIGSHGQYVFDYEKDGDQDIITNDYGNLVSDGNPFILRNDGPNEFQVVTVPMPDYEDSGRILYGTMSAAAFYDQEYLKVVYTDFNVSNKPDNEWGIELNRNVVVTYAPTTFDIIDVTQLPVPYSEANFQNIEPFTPGFLNGNGISHDVRSTPIDIDYDGDIDIIIGSQVYGENISLPQILINNDGIFQDETSSRLFNWMYATGSMHRWDFADVNDDGYLDIITKDGCIGVYTDVEGGIVDVKPYGCERKVAVNDGTGHFIAVIEPTQIMQVFEDREFKIGVIPPIFGMNSDKEISWVSMDGKGCNGCYADGNWEIFYTKLDKPLSTGPAGMDPSIVGEPGFNEFYYLLHHPDVRAAILDGKYENGLEHYLAAGKDLGYAANAKGTTHIVVESYGVNPSYSIN